MLYIQGTLAGAFGALCWSLDGLLLRIVEADAWQALFWRMSTCALALICLFGYRERSALSTGFRTMGIPGLGVGMLLAAVNALARSGVPTLWSAPLHATAARARNRYCVSRITDPQHWAIHRRAAQIHDGKQANRPAGPIPPCWC